MNKSALIVDDSIYMRKLVGKVLEDEGYTIVEEASTGKEAIRLAADLNPDIISLDNILPDMLGLDILDHFKEEGSNHKVIMVSAVGQQRVVAKAISKGAVDYILKPFDTAELSEKIKRLENLETTTR
ncbi:MAG: response regulator [Cytophagales bacterium]|nr:response regulator [Cytophagales bacterium]